ncbi:MAG: pentapeptide repeat-containing protein [Sporolactobacillus sp.]
MKNNFQTVEEQTIFLEDVEPYTQFLNCQIDTHGQRKMLADVIFSHCTFLVHDFSRAEWLDCEFKSCDFSNCTFESASLYRDKLQACKFVGTNFSHTIIKDTEFADCLMSYAFFPEAKLTAARFLSSKMNETSFQHVTLHKSQFKDSNLDLADFSETVLKGLDWSSCSINGIRIDMALAAGLKIDTFQAATLITLLGIEVTSAFDPESL